ncbi:hypothetical protein VR44_29380 [Streptomyces katrae]|uniref:Uncharacterized protein n=1 Tax=Streptomyces katrae TaxID=68223 RepID=A0A0F4IXE5_9ACTN|nr:hypothetical protein VR44_29380 [Streptomyces katrae]
MARRSSAVSRTWLRIIRSTGSGPPSLTVCSYAGRSALASASRFPGRALPSRSALYAASIAPQRWCPSTRTSGVAEVSGPYSTEPVTTASTACPPVRRTYMSPSPVSNSSSGGTRESMQDRTTANGVWLWATS